MKTMIYNSLCQNNCKKHRNINDIIYFSTRYYYNFFFVIVAFILEFFLLPLEYLLKGIKGKMKGGIG